MSDKFRTWRQQTRGAVVIAKKNALLYYGKAPVIIFGVLFPVFFFLAFKMGRAVPTAHVVPGMVAMALWFTASAVGPLVTPWERRAKTYERLISSPLSLKTIVIGDIISGFIFGTVLTAVAIILGLTFGDAAIVSFSLLTAGVLTGAFTFSALGVLVASPPASSPSQIMMLSNLVRLPLLFVSGIFVPIERMPIWAQYIAPVSPLSYVGDLIRCGFGQRTFFPTWLNLLMPIVFTTVLTTSAFMFHHRWRAKGL